MKLKWILSGVAALLVAAVVAVYAVLSTMDFEDLRGVIEAKAEEATGRKLKIAGAIDLQISLTPAISLEDVTFANAPWGSRAAMISVKRFEVEVALLPLISGDIQVNRLVLVEPDILLETNAKGRGNWEMKAAKEEKKEPEKEAAELPSINQVAIRDGRLTYRNGKTGEEIVLRLNEFVGSADSPSSPLTIAFDGAYNDAPLTIQGTLGALSALTGDQAYPVDLKIEAGGASLAIKGSIAEPMEGQGIDLKVEAKGESLATLGALTGAALPPLGPYSLSAQVIQEKKAYRLTGLAVRIGGSDIAGSGSLSLGGKRPSISGSFTAGTLDLADFQGPGAESAPSRSGDRRFVFTEEPLPLAALKSVDAKIKLSVGKLRVKPGMELADMDVELSLKGGRLQVSSFKAGVAGGKVAGSFSLDAGKKVPPLKVKLTATQIDYGGLLKQLEVSDGISGRLDGSVNLSGAGASPRAIASSLNGRIEVVGEKGSMSSSLLKGAATGLFQMLGGWRESGDDLNINCVVARLPVKGGVMTSEVILLDTSTMTVTGTGKVDLRSEALDLRITPQAKDAGLMSLAIPFLVKGTLAKPSYAPDPVGTAVGAAKVAGLFINPLAVGAILIGESQTADQNPCVAALNKSAQAPAAAPQQAAQPSGNIVEDTAKDAADALDSVGKGIAEGLKSLFGN